VGHTADEYAKSGQPQRGWRVRPTLRSMFGMTPKHCGMWAPFSGQRFCNSAAGLGRKGKGQNILILGDSMQEQFVRTFLNNVLLEVPKPASWAVTDTCPRVPGLRSLGGRARSCATASAAPTPLTLLSAATSTSPLSGTTTSRCAPTALRPESPGLSPFCSSEMPTRRFWAGVVAPSPGCTTPTALSPQPATRGCDSLRVLLPLSHCACVSWLVLRRSAATSGRVDRQPFVTHAAAGGGGRGGAQPRRPLPRQRPLCRRPKVCGTPHPNKYPEKLIVFRSSAPGTPTAAKLTRPLRGAAGPTAPPQPVPASPTCGTNSRSRTRLAKGVVERGRGGVHGRGYSSDAIPRWRAPGAHRGNQPARLPALLPFR